MKTLVIIGIAALGLAMVSTAQQINVTNVVTVYVTNSPTANPTNGFFAGLGAIGKDLLNATNIAVVPYGSVLLSGAKKGEFGGGVLILDDVNNYVGAGLGIDYLGQWEEFSGNVQLKLPELLTIFGTTNFVATPFIVGGIGTPISGAGSANGDISTITLAGIDLDFYTTSSGWKFGVGGDYGTRTGAGAYSGDVANLFFAAHRGF